MRTLRRRRSCLGMFGFEGMTVCGSCHDELAMQKESEKSIGGNGKGRDKAKTGRPSPVWRDVQRQKNWTERMMRKNSAGVLGEEPAKDAPEYAERMSRHEREMRNMDIEYYEKMQRLEEIKVERRMQELEQEAEKQINEMYDFGSLSEEDARRLEDEAYGMHPAMDGTSIYGYGYPGPGLGWGDLSEPEPMGDRKMEKEIEEDMDAGSMGGGMG